ncbi:MAG: hypothetical protein IVW57_08280 [Ktedonobacterales bacterium]|nr:hypothetical protein [Ktedonobacterales bacterium]
MKGTTHFTSGTTYTATTKDPSGAKNEVAPEKETVSPKVPNSKAPNKSPTTGPTPVQQTVTTHNFSFTGLNGLSHADQRTAGSGRYTNTQFSLEPPDQGLCVGNGYMIEAVNNAIAVYKGYSGSINRLTGPTALSQFFGIDPEINRTTGFRGPFISDPKCVYDTVTQRWFINELLLDNGSAGSGRSYNIFAVSASSDPRSTYTLFSFDTTNDGVNGTPAHTGCPCFGDQPLIGIDKWGFYVTTNEFNNAGTAFNGAQVYAINKQAAADIAGGSPPSTPFNLVQINAADLMAPYGGISYTVQPSVSAPGDYNKTNVANQTAMNGIEYFLSALDFNGTFDNRIGVWALANTRSITYGSPALNLQLAVVNTEEYHTPSPAIQKDGTVHPLRDSLGETIVERLNTNDDRMNQVSFAQNYLYGAVNTGLGYLDPTSTPYTGAAWFIISPLWNKGSLGASVHRQGYVSVAGENVLFPSIAVTKNGDGVMGLSMSGPNTFPSAVYVRISADAGTFGHVHVAQYGEFTDDGFTGYPEFGGDGTARWGDYSAAIADTDGTIWIANEYIPDAPRTVFANWGTFVSRIGTDTDL